MKKLLILTLFVSGLLSAQSDKKLVKESVLNLFFAMKAADVNAAKECFTKDAILESFDKSGYFKNTVEQFVNMIGKNEKGDLDEKVMIDEVNIDDKIASVWTPYKFYFKGKFSHCGVNNISLIKEGEKWKINHISFTMRNDNCH